MNYSNSNTKLTMMNNDSSFSFSNNSIQRVGFIAKISHQIKKLKTTINTAAKAVKKESPFLYWVVVLHFFFALIAIGGIMIDERTLMGINVWYKPLKFSISGGIYIFTVGYLINFFYPYSNRKRSIINNTVAFTLLIEVLIIVLQASRGVLSHYNQSSAFDGILFGIMGIFIGINVILMILFIFDTIRLKLTTTKSIQWAILLGWVVVFFGSWIGGQMIGTMSHSIGVADGGEGLPIVNWSTKGGDLRVAHFFGLHGIQIIPLVGLWAHNQWKAKTTRQIIVVTLFALVYAAWIGFTFYQAKQGIPLIKS